MAAPTPRPVPTQAPTPRPTGASSPPRASRLATVKSGQLVRPLRYMFYSVEGAGKTTLAADAPNMLFLDVEGSSEWLEAARYPYRDEEGGHIPHSYEDVLAAVDDLIASTHPYKHVAIDTVDALEALLHRYVCEQVTDKGGEKMASIESFGYGRGFSFALDEWRRFLSRLDRLRSKGVSVILLGHAVIRTFKNPAGEDFDRFQLRVNEKAAGLLKEWCDVVGFLRFDEGASKMRGGNPNDKRARGWSTGRRLVHTSRNAAWDAKTRIPLPAEIELAEVSPWSPFGPSGEVLEDIETLKQSIEIELSRLGDEFTTATGELRTAEKVLATIAAADGPTLHRVLTALRACAPTTSTAGA